MTGDRAKSGPHSCGGLRCQRALLWQRYISTGTHMAAEARDRPQASSMQLERRALSMHHSSSSQPRASRSVLHSSSLRGLGWLPGQDLGNNRSRAGEGRGKERGQTQVAGVCGQKPEICRGPCSCAGHWFLQWQKLLLSSAEWVTGNHGYSYYVADIGTLCPSACF